MRDLSLNCLTLLEKQPVELVEIAAATGCAYVCIFTYIEGIDLPTVWEADMAAMRRRMSDTGVKILCAATYPLTPNIDWVAWEAGLDRGGRLGALFTNCRIVDEDEARVTDNYARFAELSERYGMVPSIEPMGYRDTNVFPLSLRMIEAAGCGTLNLDPLHIIRTGTSWEWIEALDPKMTGYIQLCDGPATCADEDAYWHEGLYDRLPLGDGAFPNERLLALMPPDQPISIEVPCEVLRRQGLDGLDLAKEIIKRSRAWLERQDA